MKTNAQKIEKHLEKDSKFCENIKQNLKSNLSIKSYFKKPIYIILVIHLYRNLLDHLVHQISLETEFNGTP